MTDVGQTDSKHLNLTLSKKAKTISHVVATFKSKGLAKQVNKTGHNQTNKKTTHATSMKGLSTSAFSDTV